MFLYEFLHILGTDPNAWNTVKKTQVAAIPSGLIYNDWFNPKTIPIKLSTLRTYPLLPDMHCGKIKINSSCNVQTIIVRNLIIISAFVNCFRSYQLISCISCNSVFFEQMKCFFRYQKQLLPCPTELQIIRKYKAAFQQQMRCTLIKLRCGNLSAALWTHRTGIPYERLIFIRILIFSRCVMFNLI